MSKIAPGLNQRNPSAKRPQTNGSSRTTRLDEGGAELIRQRADIVDEATDTLERMLNSLEALPLTGEKGQAIIPLWIDEYRTYLGDRRNYAAQLRESGENLPSTKPRIKFNFRATGNICCG